MNDDLEFSWEWDMYDPDTIYVDDISLSPHIENYPITEKEIYDIAYHDAEARWLYGVVAGEEQLPSTTPSYAGGHTDSTWLLPFAGNVVVKLLSIFIAIAVIGSLLGW